MISWLKKLIGGNSPDLKKLYQEGAVIIDVRTPQEYKSGHIKGSINVPLQGLSKETGKLAKMNKPVITCCLSGGRSSAAKRILSARGIEVYNGGGWQGLQSKLRQS
ncbi:MAG: rhodanese-like domain-containing protein [Bacteroidota bacterium]|nr:rhodanese-like domain-containing protein [Bacteroidota bacterium]